MRLTVALVLFSVAVGNAQDRVVSLQGVVEFDTIKVTIGPSGTDTLYFSNVNAGLQKIDNVAGRTPPPTFNVPPSAFPFRVFNTGNNTLFFRSSSASTVCDKGYVKVQPLLYSGHVVAGDSVAVGSTTVADPNGVLNSHSMWRHVDLTSKFLMYSAVRVIISIGCAGGWTGTVAYGRVR